MLFLQAILLSSLLNNPLTEVPKARDTFIPPVKIPLLLSANFGELRMDHFHSGIDIKTQGVTGKEIIATASGYVYRIGVSPGGFGKALYLRHTSGYSTVYAHLDRFSAEIDEYVKNQQYARKSFNVTLFPPKEKFEVKQGDIIAFSGNSGSSGGPHLHYEIRRSESEIPVNPLLFEFGLNDNISPVIEKLVIYPLGKHTTVNGKKSARTINTSGTGGSYFMPADKELKISGPAGFGIKTYDLLNESYNKCAPYSIELRIDSILLYKYVMDEFSFSESRYINSHIDYETYMKERIHIQKTFVSPNDKLSAYKKVSNRGIFNFNDSKIHHVEILLTDVHSNKSSLTFKVKSEVQGAEEESKAPIEDLMAMPYNKTNKFRAEGLLLSIPARAFYDTLFFSYKKESGRPGMLSDVHHIHNKFTPVHKPYSISVKPSRIPAGKESKMLLVQLSDDLKKSALSSTFSDGYVTANALSFGKFFVGIDTLAPLISPNGLVNGADLTSRKEIKIKITDELSGIKDYEPVIDGEWALFEYDQKNNVIIYRFDPQRITKGTKHKLTLKVTDNKDNQSFYNCEFTW